MLQASVFAGKRNHDSSALPPVDWALYQLRYPGFPSLDKDLEKLRKQGVLSWNFIIIIIIIIINNNNNNIY